MTLIGTMDGTGAGGSLHEDTSLALLVVAAALDVPGVAAISPGRAVEVATYGPRTKVQGVRVTRHQERPDFEVHLIAGVPARQAAARDLIQLAQEVREAIVRRLGGLRVPVGAIHVVFDDLLPEGGDR